MKITKRIFALTTVVLLVAGVTCAEMEEVSDETSLDTRSLSHAMVVGDQDLDSRSYTVDWSEERTLNTKEIVGTLLLLR